MTMHAFVPFCGDIFTSQTCPNLNSPTVPHVRRTHIIFSFATASKDFKEEKIGNSGLRLVTVSQFALEMLRVLRQQESAVLQAVTTLSKRAVAVENRELTIVEESEVVGEEEEGDDEEEDIPSRILDIIEDLESAWP